MSEKGPNGMRCELCEHTVKREPGTSIGDLYDAIDPHLIEYHRIDMERARPIINFLVRLVDLDK